MSEAKYKRVLLKLSGEALAGENKTGVNAETIGKICDKIKEVTEMGVEVGIVVGGGNFWRGRNGHQMERATADYMGMLATAMNGLALQDALEARGVNSRVQTAIEMREIAEPFIIRKAEKHSSRVFFCFSCHFISQHISPLLIASSSSFSRLSPYTFRPYPASKAAVFPIPSRSLWEKVPS